MADSQLILELLFLQRRDGCSLTVLLFFLMLVETCCFILSASLRTHYALLIIKKLVIVSIHTLLVLLISYVSTSLRKLIDICHEIMPY